MKRLLTAFILLLASPAFAQAVGPLTEALGTDPSPKVRSQAALALAAYPADPAAVAALAQALRDDAPLGRGAAARALGQLKTPGAFTSLSVAARDRDPFVSKWAGWAVRQVLAAAKTVEIGLRGLVSRGGVKPDDATKAFQEGVLDTLLATGRFDIGGTIDFSDEPPVAAAPPQVAHVELEGEVASVTGDAKVAQATVLVRAVTPSGYVAWSGRASGSGRGGPPPPPGPDDDEWTIRPSGTDARLEAISDAGKAAGRLLADGLAAEAPKTGTGGAP